MTRSNRSPAAAQAGSISAALPTSAMEIASPGRGRGAGPGQRLGRIVRQPIDVADLEPPARPRLVDLDREADALVHRDRQRLGAAHAAEPGGQRDASRGACRRSAGGPPPRRSRTCPGGCPASRCRSRTRRSSGRTSSGRPARARGRPPRSPTCRRGSSWRSVRAAPIRGSAPRRPACRSGPGGSRRRRGAAARGRSRRRRPSCVRPGRSRRRRRGGPGPRRPPGRGCSSASAARLPAAHPRQVSSGPRGARTGRGPAPDMAAGYSVRPSHDALAEAARPERPGSTRSRRRRQVDVVRVDTAGAGPDERW